MTANDIWTANKYIKEPIGDGGSPRIPTLKSRNEQNEVININNNEDKAKAFAAAFFPKPPPIKDGLDVHDYPEPLPDPPQLSVELLKQHVAKLSPYKAHSPDDIPNVVIQQCIPIISERLTRIYWAILELRIYYDPWREFTTVVLRKPNKPIPRLTAPLPYYPPLRKC